MEDIILTEPCTCGGQLIEQCYEARDGKIYWRIWCLQHHNAVAFAVVCPKCAGLMTETKKVRTTYHDDEYTEYVCSICNYTQDVCTFDADDGK